MSNCWKTHATAHIKQDGSFHFFVCVDALRLKPQLHCHDFGHDGATTHPDLSSRDASA